MNRFNWPFSKMGCWATVLLLLSAQLAGCTRWVTQAVDPAQPMPKSPRVRVVRTDGSHLIFDRGYRLERDTLFGQVQDDTRPSATARRSDRDLPPGTYQVNENDLRNELAVPLSDIQKFQVRRAAPLATAGLIGGGLLLAVIVFAQNSEEPVSGCFLCGLTVN